MTVAAHISSGKKDLPPFLTDHLRALARQHEGVQFIFFTDRNLEAENTPTNVTAVLISPNIKNSLLLHYWYNYKLPYLLRRHNASIFISENGILSLRTDIPQIMILKNVPQIKRIHGFPNKFKRYFTKYFPVFIKKAKKIICTEDFLAQELSARFPFADKKITLIRPGLNAGYKPISWQQKETITGTFTMGQDYFLFPVSTITKQNIIVALKAFSQFKKWQKSAMKFVLLSEDILPEGLIEGFNQYRYKNDVVLSGATDVAEKIKLTSAAYAIIYLPSATLIAYDCLQAMQAEIPVITTADELNKNMYNDTVLYAAAHEKNIAEKMILLYKDEHLRNEQIKKAVLQTAKYNSSLTLAQLWNLITDTGEG